MISPVPPSLALAFAGGGGVKRRAFVHQCRIGQSIAFLDGQGRPVALAMIDGRRSRRAELCIAFTPAARLHMRELIRTAQLTLRQIAETRILVFARIRPTNRAGHRMAMLAGFQPGKFRDPAIWLWKG